MKTCTRCGLTLPTDSFYADQSKKDGFRPSCKTCMRNGQCSDCGQPVMVNKSSLAAPVCRPCRKARKTCPEGVYYRRGQRPCEACGEMYWTKNPQARACSDGCKVELGIGLRLSRSAPELVKARRQERWRQKNQKRRMVQKAAQEPYTRSEIAARDNDTCQLCTFPIDMSLSGLDKWGPTIDHILPISRGGSDTPDNVQLAHRDCNVSKGARV